MKTAVVKDHWFRAEYADDPCGYSGCGRPQAEHVESVGEWMEARHLFLPSLPSIRCVRCARYWSHSTHHGSRKNRRLYWRDWFFLLRQRLLHRNDLCWHLSHRLKLPCWRRVDSTCSMLCGRHYDSCREGC